MKKLRPLWLGALVALLLAACGAPQTPEPKALFTDADLDAATVIESMGSFMTSAVSLVDLGDAALTAADRQGGSPLLSGQLDALTGQGFLRGRQDLGGWLAYVEQRGPIYTVRIADLNDENQPKRRIDTIVYVGLRPIQSVAVSRDGTKVAFTAESWAGDNDLYLLDLRRFRATRTRTPNVDERSVTMSLDGEAIAWQGGTPEQPSLIWFHTGAGGYYEFDAATWQAMLGLPMLTAQPSISGDGLKIAVVEESGLLAAAFNYGQLPGLATIEFTMTSGGPSLTGFTLTYVGDHLESPSVSYDAGKLMFKEVYAGVPYLSLIDFDKGTVTDLLAGVDVNHPFLTADGSYATFSAFGDAMVVDFGAGTVTALSPNARTADTATYWARGNFTAYSGRNDQGTFVRPDDGSGIDAAGRTVGYHVYEFRPISNDYYSIDSVQDYDGYLNLYVDYFNPRKPEQRLLASNDDYLHAWSEKNGGRSRIVAELERNRRYYIVTSACGADGTSCGPSSGSFDNLITDGATPPAPPTQLPEPDNSRFNITLRFWNDTFTETEKGFFDTAADRWSEVITGNLENIPNFVLTESQVTPGAPAIVGELDDVVIDAAKVAIDGPGGVLARAGAFYVRESGPDRFLPIYGIMEFDEAEFGPGGFFEDLSGFAETIMHEMGHVLGFSRVFFAEHGYIVGNPADPDRCSDISLGEDPRYVGPAGSDAWHNYYGADSSTVPLANTGGCGTADSHWREIYLQDELMTGYAQGGGEPLSRVTIGAMEDLGYVVNFAAADAWSVPALPILRQVSPNPTDYAIEFDFTSAYTGSLLGNVTAEITPVDLNLDGSASDSGCEAADFAGFPAGNIALVRRGTCPFGDKATNALAAGASAILIGNQGDAPDKMFPVTGTFGNQVDIVGMPVSYDVMVELATLAANGPVVVNVNTDPNNTADSTLIGPQALPKIVWHLAEELIPLRGTIDKDGNVNRFGD